MILRYTVCGISLNFLNLPPPLIKGGFYSKNHRVENRISCKSLNPANPDSDKRKGDTLMINPTGHSRFLFRVGDQA